MAKKISIITPTYNEEANIKKLSIDIASEMSFLEFHFKFSF